MTNLMEKEEILRIISDVQVGMNFEIDAEKRAEDTVADRTLMITLKYVVSETCSRIAKEILKKEE